MIEKKYFSIHKLTGACKFMKINTMCYLSFLYFTWQLSSVFQSRSMLAIGKTVLMRVSSLSLVATLVFLVCRKMFHITRHTYTWPVLPGVPIYEGRPDYKILTNMYTI